ncbi:hypothetical protein MIMGU_mgv1a024626mg [Erythranthe guttata]|uniref:B box-type domain-containing protein n=1 Tax=Erythranthe guttata TaxID=4155 RepID=A0A022QXB5_ERYGU|nr:hypothetical protein MIMGU_mgv1a024626mg [Erythranthe guttata]
MLDSSVVPLWLSSLISDKFFNACLTHKDVKKNETNTFCFDCCVGICPQCFPNHTSHRFIQIRRYMHSDVIRLVDANKLIDCAQIQCNIVNKEKVMFINKRAQTRQPRSSCNLCVTCTSRNLQSTYIYCSLSCKLEHILTSGCDLSSYLRFAEVHESVMEQTGSLRSDSDSNGDGGGQLYRQHLTDTTATEVLKKKRSIRRCIPSEFRPVCEISKSIMNRRKCIPHRSPLH